jgi:hypothetical protein
MPILNSKSALGRADHVSPRSVAGRRRAPRRSTALALLVGSVAGGGAKEKSTDPRAHAPPGRINTPWGEDELGPEGGRVHKAAHRAN